MRRCSLLLLLLLVAATPPAAEPVIDFTGRAEFGVTHDDATGTDPLGRLTIDTEPKLRTDTGLSMGAQLRLRAEPGRAAGLAAPRFYITTGSPGALPRR